MSETSKDRQGATKTRRFAWLAAGGLLLLGGGLWLGLQSTPGMAEVTVYKSPTCGCCNAWIDHLEENGFTVKVHDHQDMAPIKQQIGVPYELRSCHTAKVGDYVLEGHVPADLVVEMLTKKPAIKGLAVPGMPMGSPGMEGPRKDPYDVVTFTDDGTTTVYASR